MESALGSKPREDELEHVQLRKLFAEDEWDEAADPPRHQRGPHKLREGAEFRPVDLPSSRGLAWRSLERLAGLEEEDISVRQRAMDIERRVVLSRLDETLGKSRTHLVDQANTFLNKIRSTGGAAHRGYNLSGDAYEEVQKQGQAVRLLAQIYNILRSKLERLSYDSSIEAQTIRVHVLQRYRVLTSTDLKCSTETYSTRGTSSKGFCLPWFWRMVPVNLEETVEEARARDETFISECPLLAMFHSSIR